MASMRSLEALKSPAPVEAIRPNASGMQHPLKKVETVTNFIEHLNPQPWQIDSSTDVVDVGHDKSSMLDEVSFLLPPGVDIRTVNVDGVYDK